MNPADGLLVGDGTGNSLYAGVPLYGDGPGRRGDTTGASTVDQLYRGGALAGETEADAGEFEVPAAEDDYRLVMTSRRGTPHTLSTEVAGE